MNGVAAPAPAGDSTALTVEVPTDANGAGGPAEASTLTGGSKPSASDSKSATKAADRRASAKSGAARDKSTAGAREKSTGGSREKSNGGTAAAAAPAKRFSATAGRGTAAAAAGGRGGAAGRGGRGAQCHGRSQVAATRALPRAGCKASHGHAPLPHSRPAGSSSCVPAHARPLAPSVDTGERRSMLRAQVPRPVGGARSASRKRRKARTCALAQSRAPRPASPTGPQENRRSATERSVFSVQQSVHGMAMCPVHVSGACVWLHMVA